MRCAYPLLAAVAFLAGCGSGGERAYYQTRYIPTDLESTYTSLQREQWQGDPTVYELPAGAPALEDTHYARRNCLPPGPRFKPQQIVGTHDEVRGSSDPTMQVIGGWDERPAPLGPLGPDKAYPVGRLGDPQPIALRQRSQWQPVGDWDQRQLPQRGPNQIQATKAGGMRDMAKTDYCMPPETPALPKK